MMALKHDQYVVEFKELFVTKNHILLVMEQLDMDLYSYLKCHHDKLSEHDIREIFRKVTECIKHCHSNNIMHRDIKPENVLVNLNADGHI